mgnify:CR=1 FL=1
MASGGDISRQNGRKGGRPKGSGAKPHISDYWTPKQIKEFYRNLYDRAETDARIAVWCGEQLSGKAAQPISNDNNEPFRIAVDISEAIAKKNNISA